MDNELFNEDSSGNDLISQDEPAKQEQLPDKFLEALVGEGKKFTDAEALAKGKYESDKHIEHLHGELSALRQELDKRLTLEEFVDKMKESRGGQPDDHESNHDNQNGDEGNSGENQNNAVTPEEIRKLVEDQFKHSEGIAKKKSNLDTVIQKAEEALGSDYKVKLAQKAKQLGLGKEFLTNLAMEQPDSFVKIMIGDDTLKQNDDIITPPKSEFTPPNPLADNSKTWNYYEKLRKENPRDYFTPQVQNEMHEQASKLGEAFYK